MKRRELLKKLAALGMAATMVVGATGCGEQAAPAPAPTAKPADATAAPADTTADAEPEDDGLIKDANGNTVDLGGVHVIIRDWWSHAVGEAPAEPNSAYEEARDEYWAEIQETYNFTFEQAGISGWGEVPEDYNNYVMNGGDENYYVFTLRDDGSSVGAMLNGLMYDLSTLDCLDFSEEKWQATKRHVAYSKGGKIFGMAAGEAEPRTGLYFNRRLLEEAGINPDSIYELQEKKEWTWAKFDEILAQVQRDTNNDGEIDVYGHCANDANVYVEAVASNGAEYVGVDASGKYVYKFNDAKTMEALNWAQNMMMTYNCEFDGDNWDYFYDAFKNGKAAFFTGDAYEAGGQLADMQDDFGWVCFPMGPSATDYAFFNACNTFVIPSCYDAEKAWKCAFVYNLVNSPIPGYEDYSGFTVQYSTQMRDTGTIDYTVPRMLKIGVPAYHQFISEAALGEHFTWQLGIFSGNTPASVEETNRDIWMQAIDKANQ